MAGLGWTSFALDAFLHNRHVCFLHCCWAWRWWLVIALRSLSRVIRVSEGSLTVKRRLFSLICVSLLISAMDLFAAWNSFNNVRFFLQCLQLAFGFTTPKKRESATNCLLLLCLSFSSPLSNMPLYSCSMICSLLLHCLLDYLDSTTFLVCLNQYP